MPDADAPARGHPIRSGTPRQASRPSLLLIDDDSLVGRFIAHAAEDCGYSPIRTTGFDRFIRIFRANPPDAVAVDLCVPGCDGVEVIRSLGEARFGGKVVIISGMDRRVMEAALRLGKALGLAMAEPLSKPFRVDELACRLGAPEAAVTA